MPKRGKKGKEKVPVVNYNSDDEEFYSKEKRPDPNSEEYFMDEIDEFHASRDKVLLEKGIPDETDYTDSEDEVLGLLGTDDESDEEIRNYQQQLRSMKRLRKKDAMGSDIEEEEDEEAGLPDAKAWGKKRNKYYGGDVDDDDVDLSGSEDDEAVAVMEEKEALALQKKMAAELDEEDFDLDIFKKAKVSDDKNKMEEKIVKDLSMMSKREKLKLLQKESPELLTLIDDFKAKMTEVKDIYYPLLMLVKEGRIQGKAADYVDTKFRLLLNYCINISFYMMLKSKQSQVQNHPVIKRLVQYRNLMKQLEPVDEQVKSEVAEIIDKLQKGEEIEFAVPEQKKKEFIRRKPTKRSRARAERKKLSELVSESEEEMSDEEITFKKKGKLDERYETQDEKEALEYYRMMKGEKGGDLSSDNDEKEEDGEEFGENIEGSDDDVEGKRAVTYQIEKNKNVQIKRKKEDRNPRVKLRKKFRKAKIRRKGQIREVRKEMSRYGGEISGIRAGIKRSVRIKT